MHRCAVLLRPLARSVVLRAPKQSTRVSSGAVAGRSSSRLPAMTDLGEASSQSSPVAPAAARSSQLDRAKSTAPMDQTCPCCFGAVHKSTHRQSLNPSLDLLFRPFSTKRTMAAAGSESVISLILADHRTAEADFAKYNNESDQQKKQEIAWKLIKEISQHGAQEEMSIYPWMKKNHPDTAKKIDHGIHEHQRLKEDLAKLDSMKVTDPEFDSTIQRVWKDLSHHIKEEESDILPALEKRASAAELAELGKTFVSMKSIAPTRPHPLGPSQGGPGTMAANAGAAVVDKMRDAAREATK